MSDEHQSVGQYIVALLAANGIDTVFGIPGVHNLEFYRGLASTGLRHILVRHEQNAGFAADGFARASGRPAAAFVISGPGLTNILTWRDWLSFHVLRRNRFWNWPIRGTQFQQGSRVLSSLVAYCA